jgi:mono/diheme cytochrome c family protein
VTRYLRARASVCVVATVAAGLGLFGFGFAGSGFEHDRIDRAAALRTTATQFEPRDLTVYSADKARRLIRDHYACLGCHQLDGEGGSLAPDLSTVGSRLTPDAIYLMIRQPEMQVPGTVMPAQLMTNDRRVLIASFLATRGSGGTRAAPVIDPTPRAEGGTGGELYARFCSSCHGVNGNGDGFNAESLPVPPTAHSDSAYMSTRPDDTIYDGIHAGGRILGRNHRMPAFGRRLSPGQIRSLVRYIRELCDCTGPAWSRDGGAR